MEEEGYSIICGISCWPLCNLWGVQSGQQSSGNEHFDQFLKTFYHYRCEGYGPGVIRTDGTWYLQGSDNNRVPESTRNHTLLQREAKYLSKWMHQVISTSFKDTSTNVPAAFLVSTLSNTLLTSRSVTMSVSPTSSWENVVGFPTQSVQKLFSSSTRKEIGTCRVCFLLLYSL